MELSCSLGITRLVPQDQRSFFGVSSHIINPLFTKPVRSRCLDIGLVLFLRVYGPGARFSKVPKLYGPLSVVTIPSLSQERRGFKSSNFKVSLPFGTLKAC